MGLLMRFIADVCFTPSLIFVIVGGGWEVGFVCKHECISWLNFFSLFCT